MTGANLQMPHRAGEFLHGFHGGIKLRHYKHMSTVRPLARPPLPEALHLSLLQQAGQASHPVVEPGQAVAKGELLAEAGPGLSAPLHAPTSGTIKEITEAPLIRDPNRSAPALVLIPDGDDRWHPDCERKVGNWRDFSRAELIRRIAASGTVGLGGAVFPTHRKLTGPWTVPPHTLILNGAECEPYISCDEMLMREYPRDVILGARITARALGADDIVIAIEDQLGELHRALDGARRELDMPGLRIARVPAVYPEGGERQLIKMLTGLEVPSGGYPQQLGMVCINVATAWSIKRALIDRIPLIERVITVTGAVGEPRNWLGLLGTPVRHLLEASGGLQQPDARVVLGGPLMGVAIPGTGIGLDKGSNCLLALHREQLRRPDRHLPCINCGECVRVCPAVLLPQMLYHAVRKDDRGLARELKLDDCIECGCCDLVCPSQIPLTDYFRAGKAILHDELRERERAAKSAERHDARGRRLQQQAAEREQQERRRQARASDPEQARAVIQAALERARNQRHKSADEPENKNRTGRMQNHES